MAQRGDSVGRPGAEGRRESEEGGGGAEGQGRAVRGHPRGRAGQVPDGVEEAHRDGCLGRFRTIVRKSARKLLILTDYLAIFL